MACLYFTLLAVYPIPVRGTLVLNGAMLIGLTKRFRFKAALALIALYALCILVPHAALALGSNAAAHCLKEGPVAAHVHAAEATPHSHAGGGEHHHHDAGAALGHADSGVPHKHSGQDGKGHAGNCCGLFCVSALALEAATALHAPPVTPSTPPGLHEFLAGRGPDRLIRPPIA